MISLDDHWCWCIKGDAYSAQVKAARAAVIGKLLEAVAAVCSKLVIVNFSGDSGETWLPDSTAECTVEVRDISNMFCSFLQHRLVLNTHAQCDTITNVYGLLLAAMLSTSNTA